MQIADIRAPKSAICRQSYSEELKSLRDENNHLLTGHQMFQLSRSLSRTRVQLSALWFLHFAFCALIPALFLYILHWQFSKHSMIRLTSRSFREYIMERPSRFTERMPLSFMFCR